METPEREQNSTSESSEDPDRILVEKVIIPVSDTVKQDPVKKTSALKQGEVADDCCSTSEPSEDPDQILIENYNYNPRLRYCQTRSSEKDNGSQARRSG